MSGNVITCNPDATYCELHHVSRYKMQEVGRRILAERQAMTICKGCRAALIQLERDALNTDRRAAKELTDNDVTNLEKIAALRGEIGRLRRALLEYGRHKGECPRSDVEAIAEGFYGDNHFCSCGFSGVKVDET